MSKSPKAILRLSRRAARSASATVPLAQEPHLVAPWRRSLHFVSLSAQQPVLASVQPHPVWYDSGSTHPASTQNSGSAPSSSSSSQQAKSGNPPQYSHHAILPCSELGPPLNGSEAYALTALQAAASNSPLNLSLLPIYQAPPDLSASSSRSSSKSSTGPERSAGVPQLCFGRNGAAGIPKNSHILIPSIVGSTGEEQSQNSAATDEEQSVQVGEDAYFVRSDSMGVSDGVGGWSRHAGADSALFSRLLMHNCATEFARYEDIDDPAFLEYDQADPVGVLGRASKQCIEDALSRGVVGSSTALICVLRNNTLRVANLGDCNVSVIRGTRYIFRSAEQQHSFNHPFQIGSSSKDSPEKDAQRLDVQVQKGDIVILSSDGLIDNLYELDILEEVLKFSHPSYDARTEPLDATPASPEELSSLPAASTEAAAAKFSPQQLSEALCTRAKAVMMDPFVVASPFADRATEQGLYYSGGKKDDVTCLIGVVGEVEASEDRR